MGEFAVEPSVADLKNKESKHKKNKYDGQYENSKLSVSNQKILLIGLIVTVVAILFVQTGGLYYWLLK